MLPGGGCGHKRADGRSWAAGRLALDAPSRRAGFGTRGGEAETDLRSGVRRAHARIRRVERGQMSSEQSTRGAALADWFDDADAPEEVQALRAWVAGLSAELAQG